MSVDRATLKRGARGSEVQFLQTCLTHLNAYEGIIDGIFGKNTEKAVKRFQEDIDELSVDGVVGSKTWGALCAAMDIRTPTLEKKADHEEAKEPEKKHSPEKVWPSLPRWLFARMSDAANNMVKVGVNYGPGRGHADVDKKRLIVTIGPYGLNSKGYRTADKTYGPAFVCSTFTYFMLCYLFRVNEQFNRAMAGGQPSISDVINATYAWHKLKGASQGYWGFKPFFKLAKSDGSSRGRRKKLSKHNLDMDMIEIWERRKELPEIMFCLAASTRKGFFHHTAIIYIDRSRGYQVKRIAADGGKNSQRVFSGTDMDIELVDEAYAKKSQEKGWYRCYGVIPDNLDMLADKPDYTLAFEKADGTIIDV